MNRIKISDEAVQDLNDGYWFYEIQEKGLGDYFASSLRSEIDRLKFYAGIHSVVYEDFHHLVCKKFPFGIFSQSSHRACYGMKKAIKIKG